MITRENLRIRDPFILVDRENKCYYMYGTTDLEDHCLNARNTFTVYKSYDLETFDDGKVVVDGNKLNFWADRDFWAPEVHFYKGKYYLFGSCIADGKCRCTQIYVCDTPDGEFVPLSDKARTPENWVCLDGTFYVENGTPYMVFSREWIEVKDGQMWAIQLSDDLKDTVGEPFKLFNASEAKDVTEFGGIDGAYITDGPFMYRENGKLRMMLSSFNEGRYVVLIAESDSIRGKWTHLGSQYDFCGGHGMIFTDLEGNRMISLHSPNTADLERAKFFDF